MRGYLSNLILIVSLLIVCVAGPAFAALSESDINDPACCQDKRSDCCVTAKMFAITIMDEIMNECGQDRNCIEKKCSSRFSRDVEYTEEMNAYEYCMTLINRALEKQPETQKGTTAESNAGQSKQEKRLALINQMISDGILIKVEKPAQLPRAYVGRAFYSLPFDDKQAVASIILAYFLDQDPKADILILRDGYTNKEIGKFDEYGLRLK